MRLGVIVPLANEEDSLDEFLTRVLAQLGPDDAVFCVVDNVSRDSTRAMVIGWGTRDHRVRLVWAPENRCVVDAYVRGYRAALDAGSRWVLEMDGGLSHAPEQIPQFISAMEQGYDYAGGCRFMPGGSYKGGWKRYLVSRGGGVVTNLLLGTRMRDMTSGFECFSRRALEYILVRGLKSRAHFFQTEIKFALRYWHWVEVPIHYTNPSARLGMGSIREAFSNLWGLYRESCRVAPAIPEAAPGRRAA